MNYLKIFLFITVFGCAANNNTQTSSLELNQEVVSNEINPTNVSITLADYLKRIPGITVQGQEPNVRVLVRGGTTLSGQNKPLFIIDGMNAGFGYEVASPLVDINDIASVHVLKSGVETARYGMQGNNGVIIIKTKKSN